MVKHMRKFNRIKKVAVVGAGPAGATAAYQLVKAGCQVDLYEAGSAVGGLSRTISLWGQRVDLGPHRFFSNDRRINELWLEVVGKDYAMVDRLTRIYYKKRFFHYPLRPFNALSNLGPWESARCVSSFGLSRLSPRVDAGDSSFEQWVVARFGRRLFEIFFKTYSEKLWGIACQDLDADFAAQRIKGLSLGQAIKSAVTRRHGGHKTLVDRFAYAHGGSGVVYERMVQAVQARGGRLLLETPIRRLIPTVFEDGSQGAKVELPSGETQAYDHVVSTIPLTQMVKALPGVPEQVCTAADRLRFRNTVLVYLHVDGRDLFPDNWLYVHSPDLGMGRITNFRNWVPHLYGKQQTTILAAEYWGQDTDPIWQQSPADLIDAATREISSTGLLKGCRVLDGHVVKIPRSYPVYDRGYRNHVAVLADYLRSVPSITAIGRYGSFKYNNQDHSILMGLLAAENIATSARHDLWAVNSDYDSYQESSTICESGLDDQEELKVAA